MHTKKTLISCSELGQVARCAYAVELKARGGKPNAQAQIKMAKGNEAHDDFNTQLQQQNSSRLSGLKWLLLTLFVIGCMLVFLE